MITNGTLDKAFFCKTFEMVFCGILFLDEKTYKILDINPFLENLLGYKKDLLLGKKIEETGIFENTKKALEIFQKIQKKNSYHVKNFFLKTKTGKLIQTELSGNTFLADKTKKIIQCFIYDVTKQKKSEKRKNDFIETAIHDFKSPITALKGFSYMLNKSMSSDKKSEYYLSKIDRQVDKLMVIINKLSDVTKN